MEKIQTQIRHDSIKHSVNRDGIQHQIQGGIRTGKGQRTRLANVKNAVANTVKISGAAGKTAIKAVKAVPSGGSTDNIGAAVAGETKRTATDVAKKSSGVSDKIRKDVRPVAKSSVQRFSVKQIKTVKAAKARALKRQKAVKQRIAQALQQTEKAFSQATNATATAKIKSKVKSIKSAKKRKFSVSTMVGKSVAVVSTTAAVAQKTAGAFSSNNRGAQTDTGSDLSHTVKDSAEKAAGKSVEGVRKISGRVRKTVKKAVNPTGRTLQKAQKRAIKKTAQTTAKTAKKTAKAAAKAAKKTAEATAKAAKAAAQLSAKIISAIAEAVGAIAASPVGLVVLIVAVVIILIMLIMGLISGSIGGVAGTVAPAVSSLEWLFGDTQSNDWDELTEKYQEYIEMADSAFDKLAGFAGGLSFGERDTLVFNGAEFYPASSGLYYVQQTISNMTFDDVYFVQLYYVYMLRYSDEPEMTAEGMYDFMYNLYFDISVTTAGGYACPTADCTTTTWSHPSGYCPDVGEDEDCPGHETAPFCPHNHKRITVTFSARPDITDFLNFTDDELEMLDLGYMTLLSMFATEDG